MTTDSTRTDAEMWDDRYRGSDRIWSGNPNVVLVREVEGLTPGRALDLGCGEGADAVWLARWGWKVTATDISRVALERAAVHAAEADVADRIDWQWHDLGASFPEGEYDLVSAQFLHSMGDLPRERILRRAALAVAPGGVLLVVGHMASPPGITTTRTWSCRRRTRCSPPSNSLRGSGRCCSARSTNASRTTPRATPPRVRTTR